MAGSSLLSAFCYFHLALAVHHFKKTVMARTQSGTRARPKGD
jgi:hypothetical protein